MPLRLWLISCGQFQACLPKFAFLPLDLPTECSSWKDWEHAPELATIVLLTACITGRQLHSGKCVVLDKISACPLLEKSGLYTFVGGIQ